MSGVSLETFWAIKKHWNNKFYYTAAFCWLFLYDLYYDARIHDTSSKYLYYDARIHDTSSKYLYYDARIHDTSSKYLYYDARIHDT